MTSSRRVLYRCMLVLVLALGAARSAAAMSVVEPLAFWSFRTEPSTSALGAGAAIGMASFDIVPAVEYVYADNSTDWAIDVDAHLPVLALPLVALYMGAGVGFYSQDPDVGDSSTDTGVNVLFGAKGSIGRFKPFGEIRYTTAGPDGIVFMLGTRFHLFD